MRNSKKTGSQSFQSHTTRLDGIMVWYLSPTDKTAHKYSLIHATQHDPIGEEVTKNHFSNDIAEQYANNTCRMDGRNQHGICPSSALQLETSMAKQNSGLDLGENKHIPCNQVNRLTSPLNSLIDEQKNLHAPSVAINQAAASLICIKPGSQAVPTKMFKNTENKSIDFSSKKKDEQPSNISSSKRVNRLSLHSRNHNARNTLSETSQSQNYEPVLQVKRYDNEMDTGNTECKMTNGVKQKKQILNKHKSQSSSSASDKDAKSLNDQKHNIPLSVNMDSANVTAVVNMRSHKSSNKQWDFEPEVGSSLSHYPNFDDCETFGNVVVKSNFNPIHNDLWNTCSDNGKQSKSVNKKKFKPLNIVTNNQCVDNDLEMDTDSQIDTTERSILKASTSLSHSSDNWNPTNPHADNVYKHLVCNVEPAINSQKHVAGTSDAISNAPGSSATSSITNLSLSSLDGLNSTSNSESSSLPGDGCNPCADDSFLAQSLQEQFDQEHIEFGSQNQTHFCPEDYYSHHSNQGINNISSKLHLTSSVDQHVKHDNDYVEIACDTYTEHQNVSPPSNGCASDRHARTLRSHEELYPIFVSSDDEASVERDEINTFENYRLSPGILAQLEDDDDPFHQTLPVPTVPLQASDSGTSTWPSPIAKYSNDDHEHLPLGQELMEDDEAYVRQVQTQLKLDEEIARALQEEEHQQRYVEMGHRYGAIPRRSFRTNYVRRGNQPLHTRYEHLWNYMIPQAQHASSAAAIVGDRRNLSFYDYQHRQMDEHHADEENAYLTPIRNLPTNEGRDIPSRGHYSPYQEYDPDYVQDEFGESRLVSINRDPYYLANVLMHRSPDMMIPNDVDLNDYEALWELAEHLGEVRRVGMEQSEISLLPVQLYQPMASDNHGNDKTNCSVCLCDYICGDKLRNLPCCHTFHVDCIDEWLKRNAVCPVCRQSAKLDQ